MALPVGETLTDRYGAGRVTLIGAGLLVVTTVPFLLASAFSAVALTVILVVRDVGVAWAQMPAMAAAYAAVTAKQMGDATTLVNIVQRVGRAVGAIGLVVALTQTGGSASAGAYRWAFAALLALSALLLVTGTDLRRHDRA